MFDQLTEAVRGLTCVIDALQSQLSAEHECRKSHAEFATKTDLQQFANTIMTKISEFADKQNAFNDQIDAAVSGLSGDVKSLNDQIAALQNTSGVITAEDQALLDGIQTRSQAVADKLAALDQLTPPVAPLVTPAV